MFYVHAQMVVFSEHVQDVLLFYLHVFWVGGTELCPQSMGVQEDMPIMFVLILLVFLGLCMKFSKDWTVTITYAEGYTYPGFMLGYSGHVSVFAI